MRLCFPFQSAQHTECDVLSVLLQMCAWPEWHCLSGVGLPPRILQWRMGVHHICSRRTDNADCSPDFLKFGNWYALLLPHITQGVAEGACLVCTVIHPSTSLSEWSANIVKERNL